MEMATPDFSKSKVIHFQNGVCENIKVMNEGQ